MYSPSDSFMRDLKSLDRRLGCKFNPRIERFVITYKRALGDELIMFVVKREEDGGFRFPDRRDIEGLQKYDMEKTTLNEYLGMISKYMDDYREAHKRRCRQDTRDRTKDDKIQLIKALARPEAPKTGGGYFRKITPNH